MPKIKAVLFDLGNTLLYFNGTWPQVHAQADLEIFNYLQSTGMEIDKAVFLQKFRGRINEYFERREIELIELTTAYILREVLKDLGYPKVGADILRTALEKMYRVSQAQWLLEDDCIDMLENLSSNGYKLGIVSNASDDADVQRLVEKEKIRSYFDFVLSSAAVGIRKPDPQIFSIALSYWGFSNEEVVMVGDTLNADILGAKNAKIRSIWVKRRAVDPNALKLKPTLVPDKVVDSLSEIPEIINNIT